MKFLANVLSLNRTIHISALRSLNCSQKCFSSNNFTSIHSQTNSMKLVDCIEEEFETKWLECKKQIPDFNSIFLIYDNYDDDDEDEDDDHDYARDRTLETLYNKLKKDDHFDVNIILHNNTTSNNDNLSIDNSDLTQSSHTILAHRSILSTVSSVFERFLSEHNHTAPITIDLYDVDMETMKELMLFMYTLEFSENNDIIFKQDNMGEKLLYTALKYEIDDLICLCDEILSKKVNDNNVHALYKLGQVFDRDLTELLWACKKYMSKTKYIQRQLTDYALRGLAGVVEEDVKGHNSEGQPKIDVA